MDPRQFRTYNCLDAACTFEIRNEFWHELKEQQNEFAYNLTIRLFGPLMYMQERGIRVDFDRLDETRREVCIAIDETQEALNSLCGRPLNVNSPKDCQAYFYIEKGITPYTSRKTGAITTDDTAMTRLARGLANRKPLPEASLVQELRSLIKLRSTYLDINFDADGRMRCSYNPRGTRFGRLSSSKTIRETGMNMQNLPSEFKKFLSADPAHFFIEFDKRQAEWVVVAYLARDANMIRVIEEGLDPHAATALMMFGVPIELIKKEAKRINTLRDAELIAEVRKELGIYGPTLIRNMSLRQCGKKSNHGLNYDEGPDTFSLLNEMDLSDAKRCIQLYHLGYPNIRQIFHDRVRRDLSTNRTLRNCFGRAYTFLDAWSHDLLKAGYAFLPQSTVVDSLNLGMCDIYESQLPMLANAELLGQVHDSVLIQLPISDAPILSDIFRQVDNYLSPELEYYGTKFKIATDAKVGFNWGTYNSDTNPGGMRDYKDGDLSWLGQ